MRPGQGTTTVDDITSEAGAVRMRVSGSTGSHTVAIEGDVPAGADSPADVALAVALLPAMTAGGDLRLPASPSPRLRAALDDIQAILRALSMPYVDEPLSRVHLDAPVARTASADSRAAGDRVAAFFSGGVDSLATVMAHPEVTDLVYVHGFDIPLRNTRASAVVEDRLATAADAFGKRLLTIRTNIRDLLDPAITWEIAHGPALAAVALALEPICGRVLIASTATYDRPLMRGSHPLHDHLWSTETCRIEHDGTFLSRAEKVGRIASSQAALDALRVCWRDVDRYNCGRCEKCVRTMVALEAVGALDRCPTFAEPLDLRAVAALDMAGREYAAWHENLELARRRGASRELIGAIEALLATEPPTETELLEVRVSELADERDAARRELDALLSSRSWRLTSAFRRAGRAARALRRRA